MRAITVKDFILCDDGVFRLYSKNTAPRICVGLSLLLFVPVSEPFKDFWKVLGYLVDCCW